MTADQRLLAASFVVSATAYLVGCLAVGVVWRDGYAIFSALLALGANACSYFCQFNGWRGYATVVSIASWIWGVISLISLVATALRVITA